MIENPAQQIMIDKSTTGVGSNFPLSAPNQYPLREIQVEIAGTGAVTATVAVERSLNNGRNWRPHFTIALSGTTSDGFFGTFYSNGAGNMRLNVTAISGTSAKINAWIG